MAARPRRRSLGAGPASEDGVVGFGSSAGVPRRQDAVPSRMDLVRERRASAAADVLEKLNARDAAREERYREGKEKEAAVERATAWLRHALCARAALAVKAVLNARRCSSRAAAERDGAAKALQRQVRGHRQRALNATHSDFMRRIAAYGWRLKFQLRCARRALAAMRLRTFLREFAGQATFRIVVLKFVAKMKIAQRNIRGFLACKRARLLCLRKLWDEAEKRALTPSAGPGAADKAMLQRQRRGSTGTAAGAAAKPPVTSKLQIIRGEGNSFRKKSVAELHRSEASSIAHESAERLGAVEAIDHLMVGNLKRFTDQPVATQKIDLDVDDRMKKLFRAAREKTISQLLAKRRRAHIAHWSGYIARRKWESSPKPAARRSRASSGSGGAAGDDKKGGVTLAQARNILFSEPQVQSMSFALPTPPKMPPLALFSAFRPSLRAHVRSLVAETMVRLAAVPDVALTNQV